MNICIIGAGTVSLSVAFKLLEEIGDEVQITIIAESFTVNTTSCGSGGLWEPYAILGTPDELVNKWGKIAFDYFMNLYFSSEAAEAGVQLLPAYSLMTADEYRVSIMPTWNDIVINFKVIERDELEKLLIPDRFVAAYSFQTLVIDQKYYMQYMMKLLHKRGVRFEQRKLNSIDEIKDRRFDGIVNCAGLGAHSLVNDDEMYPIRGQVLRIK
jgi:glycine/D-amino acid oxidase-like deaminating enzyme